MLTLAFKKVPARLKEEFSSEKIEDYQWGKIHQVKYTIIPFSEVPLLNKILGRQYPSGGNSRTANVAIFAYPAKKYTAFATPAIKFMTDMDKTYYSIETGQSDRHSSPFFDQFMDKIVYHEYIPRNIYK